LGDRQMPIVLRIMASQRGDGEVAKKWNDEIAGAIVSFVAESPANRCAALDDGPFWVDPLVGFASGDDPIFQELKRVIGEFHFTPREIMRLHLADSGLTGADADAEEVNVVSWVLPASEPMRASNRRETKCPSRAWAYGRWYGEQFNVLLRQHVVTLIEEWGGHAVAPMLSPHFERKRYARIGFASNWSERHVAYACGLGTFGLSGGLITPKGMAMRVGSVVTTLPLEPTPRAYSTHTAYCLFYRGDECGKCIVRCPAGAIDECGNDKERCYQYAYVELAPKKEEYGVDVTGCGLCQTDVPCEFRIPEEEPLKN